MKWCSEMKHTANMHATTVATARLPPTSVVFDSPLPPPLQTRHIGPRPNKPHHFSGNSKPKPPPSHPSKPLQKLWADPTASHPPYRQPLSKAAHLQRKATPVPRTRMATPSCFSITPDLPQQTKKKPRPSQPRHVSNRSPSFMPAKLSLPSLPDQTPPIPRTSSVPCSSDAFVSHCLCQHVSLSAPSHSRPTRRPSRIMRAGSSLKGTRDPCKKISQFCREAAAGATTNTDLSYFNLDHICRQDDRRIEFMTNGILWCGERNLRATPPLYLL